MLARGLVFYPPLAVHRERYVVVGCLLVGVLVSALGVLTLPSYVGPILAVSLGLFAVPLAAYRASRTSGGSSAMSTDRPLPRLGAARRRGSILEGRRLADPRLRVGPVSSPLARRRPFIAAGGRLQLVSISTSTPMIWVGRRRMKTNSEDSGTTTDSLVSKPGS